MKRLIILGILFLAFTAVKAQHNKAKSVVLPLNLSIAVSQADPTELVHLYVKGDADKIQSWLGLHGGRLKYPFRNYLAICLQAQFIPDLVNLSFIDYIHFEHAPGQPLLSSSLNHTNANDVHAGNAGLPMPFTGEGVIVGIIDAGIELQHPDFLYPDSSTRVIALWDQTMPVSATRTPFYGYGQVWDSADINAGICPHQDQTQWFGHGTNTTGIAASNGLNNSDYKGFAPDAELIIVSSNFNALGWTSTVADAVDYIFSKAEALGKPCVINASIGTYLGSHDARDLAAQAIEDDIISTNGRVLVCAAGNSGNLYPYHLGYEASQDTNFTWFELPQGTVPGQGSIFFELYGDEGDFENVKFSIGADRVVGSYAFRGSTAFDSVLNRLLVLDLDTLMSTSGNQLATVQTWADSLNGTYRMQFLITGIDSVLYRYRLQITGSGRFDLWSAAWLGLRNMTYQNLPTIQDFPPIQYYKTPDLAQSIVSSWACSDKVITVGNYINRSNYIDVDGNFVTLPGAIAGEIAENSSYGPTRTQLLKPDITAPGDFTLTAGAFFQLNNLLNTPTQRNRVGPGGLHHRAGGTSSASPAVAGSAALFLSHCSKADWSDVKGAMIQSAYADAFTGALPSTQWGNGKLNALEALKYVTPSSELQYLDNEICLGESLNIQLDQPADSIVWNNGSLSQSIQVNQTGQYFASMYSEIGCLGYSDTVNVFVRPLPTKPAITVVTDTPACAGELVNLKIEQIYGGYEWSNGSFQDEISVSVSGNYGCAVLNQFGCMANADSVFVRFYPTQSPASLHRQVPDRLVLITDYPAPIGYTWFLNGEVLSQQNDSILNNPSIGTYAAAYIDSNGCVFKTDHLNVTVLAANEVSLTGLKVYPNPFEDILFIEQPFVHEMQWEIKDMLGRTINYGQAEGGVSTIGTLGFEPGTYVLRLFGNGIDERFTLIK
jgi:subtilisin family serine protease